MAPEMTTSVLTTAELNARLARLPRAPLGCWPTPLEDLQRLRQAWGGPRLLVKRDDLSGLAFGGNKVRHAEFKLGRALADGCDVVVMAREQYSNNARITTAAAIKLGLRMVLLVPSKSPVPLQGNRLLEELLGAEVTHLPTEDPAAIRAAVQAAVERARAAGHRPFDNDGQDFTLSPTLGYVAGALELVEQLAAQDLEPSAVYIAAGNSHTGLLLGLRLLGKRWPVVGIAVELRRAELLARQRAAADQACALLEIANPLVESDFEIQDQPLGEGFQRLTPEARAVMAQVARTEALILDPVYTAKVMAGLRADVQRGRWRPADTLLFLHSGGLPALFSMPDSVEPSTLISAPA
jgi:1-aminocyclopropane-1-carboxylate deaminase/D-cysteine desulfhydrase-like pyridoxal-dependent ACC family enzyme